VSSVAIVDLLPASINSAILSLRQSARLARLPIILSNANQVFCMIRSCQLQSLQNLVKTSGSTAAGSYGWGAMAGKICIGPAGRSDHVIMILEQAEGWGAPVPFGVSRLMSCRKAWFQAWPWCARWSLRHFSVPGMRIIAGGCNGIPVVVALRAPRRRSSREL